MMTGGNLSGRVVRLGVTAGGCSGYSYVLDIVDKVHPNDRIFETDGVRLVCDPRSFLYVNGTEVDFDALGGGFKFNNPNVKRSCGCGTSFAA
jgi:iron-sulfur cluster assembly protein